MKARARKRIFALVAATTFGAMVVACQLVAGIDRLEKTDPPVVPPEAAVEAAPPIPDPCHHAVPPDPPDADLRPNLDQQLDPFFLAFREVHLLGMDDAGVAQGFDLDGVCSCDTRPGTAYDGGFSCRGSKLCDGVNGIDNGQSAVFDVFGAYLPNGEDLDEAAGVNKHIAQGIQGILLYISEYNGLADDQNVAVGFILSHGIRDPSGCPNPDAAAPPYAPGWCGNDIWSVDPEAVLGKQGMYAPTLAGRGYVSNWKLVVTDDRGYFQVPFGGLSVQIFSPIVVATIVPLDSAGNPRDPSLPPSGPSDRNYRLDNGILTGRVPATTMVEVAGALVAPVESDGGPVYVCQIPQFPIIKGELCAAADIAASKTADFDDNTVCDSVSTASTFNALPATAGEVYRPDDFLNGCVLPPDGGADGGGEGGLDAAAISALQALYRCPPR